MIKPKPFLMEYMAGASAMTELLTDDDVATAFDRLCGNVLRALENGGKTIWLGNGGSAAEAQHLSAELVGRFETDGPGIASWCLSSDMAVATAIGNDFGFENVFARQVEALASADDTLIALSTSGTSPNVVRAIGVAKSLGLSTALLTGAHPHADASADVVVRVPSMRTAHIQEGHLMLGHALCGWVEGHFRR